ACSSRSFDYFSPLPTALRRKPPLRPFSPLPARTMAVSGNCEHSFKMVKSDNSLIHWICNMCHSGPHWFIFECQRCKLKTCRPCSQKA
ncbi:uncharacterized protein BKCO1_1290002, partial [Diplodia corticola]